MSLEFGFEGATSLAEKIQPLVRFPILMRVVLPGALATAVVYPFTPLRSDVLSAPLAEVWRQLLVVLGLLLLLGAIISALGDKIYQIYEGRSLWPRWLFDRLQLSQTERVKVLLNAAADAKKGGRTLRYNEIWFTLRMYPLDDKGGPYASHPTLLGNILAGYEDYPKTRYGMDSVFFWPRLWFEVEKEKKVEIDGTWSVADGLLYLSAISLCAGVLWIAAGVIRTVSSFPSHLPFGAAAGSALAGLVLLVLGYAIYRLSLGFHRRNGEMFKTIFDLYRDNISSMTRLGDAEIRTWQGTWSYLQYLRIYCAKCRRYFPANEEQCGHCGHPSVKSFEELKRANTDP